ncbi:hypothetical protein [Alkalihalobacillus pseudalcaliphilus]|nr:hypothetical protein [Alkalihalobacillus pseudalcaliphilus]
MSSYELVKLLKDKKILDSLQFLTSCQYKLASAEISFKALGNICLEQFNNFDEERDRIFKSVVEKGSVTLHAPSEDNLDYFGEPVARNVVIDKLTIEIFSTLHSFFDTFGQWLNSALFANQALPIKQVTFNKVVDKLAEFPEYTGSFITSLNHVTGSSEYKFISDLNNVVKHRFQIYTQARFNLFNGEKNLTTPKFRKESNIYSEKELLDITKGCLDYCYVLYQESINFIESYYKSNDNNYVSNRIYNPNTHLVFDNYEDVKQLKNIINSIHFVELDKSNLENEYQILLVSDDKESKTIEFFNSVYSFIAVKDINTKEYIGLLKPDDSEEYLMDDGRNIEYRRYVLESTGYEQELHMNIVDNNIKVFPRLSNLNIMVINP